MYNESAIAADCARTLHKDMTEAFIGRGDDFEVVFADDGSTDDCAAKVRAAADETGDGRIVVCGYEVNHGKGCAVRHAVQAASGDIILYTDCDLAYGTKVIPEAVRRITDEGLDMVIGSRSLTADGYEGYTLFRKAASKIYLGCVKLLCGFGFSDSQCGFKAFRGEAAKQIFSRCETDGFAFDLEVLITATAMGMKVGEMPVKIINHRESTVHAFSDSFKMLADVMRIKKRVKNRQQ